MDKYVQVKVKTEKGERALSFEKVNEPPTDELICVRRCPYGKICGKIPDPRDLHNPSVSFIDFCGELRDMAPEGKEDLYDSIIPVAGTIEENLGDLFDIDQELLKENPLVRLRDIVDKVCSGWCENFDETYCNCNRDNKTCFLHDLFKNTNATLEEDPTKEGNEDQEKKN